MTPIVFYSHGELRVKSDAISERSRTHVWYSLLSHFRGQRQLRYRRRDDWVGCKMHLHGAANTTMCARLCCGMTHAPIDLLPRKGSPLKIPLHRLVVFVASWPDASTCWRQHLAWDVLRSRYRDSLVDVLVDEEIEGTIFGPQPCDVPVGTEYDEVI